MPYVYSTLTCANVFPVYASKTDAKAMSRIVKRILINGGHGMKNPDGLDTPRGVVTTVTDEELKILLSIPAFNQQVKDGYLSVDDKKVEPAKKAQDMNPKDGSAPLTPTDFDKGTYSTDEAPVYKERKKPSI